MDVFNDSCEFIEPTMLVGDYFQIICNSVCLVIGVPLNLITLYTLVRRQKRLVLVCLPTRYGTPVVMCRKHSLTILMHMQVNITDLCILLFYSLGRVTWLFTWQWHTGLLSCRLMRLLEQFAFASSSNVLVVIAIERMYSLCRPFSVCARARVHITW